MPKLSISLDEYLIPKKDRKEILGFFGSFKDKEVSECDTHAKGGLIWFPIDLIILVSGLTVAGFFQELGKDIYLKLKSKIKELLYKFETPEKIDSAFVAFEVEGKVLYFMLEDKILEEDFDEAFDKIQSEFSEISEKFSKFLKTHPEELFGEFESLTLKYDWEEKRWIIGWLNKDK